LKRVKEQLRAVPRRGLGYGLLRYGEDPETARRLADLPQAEVIFNYLGQLDGVFAADAPFTLAAEPSGPAMDPSEPRPHLLEVAGWIEQRRLVLTWTYSAGLHRAETIQRLAQGTLERLRRLIAHCLAPEAGGPTPSDFPLAGLDQAALDRLLPSGRR